MNLRYAKAESVFLKQHPDYNERWLQDHIADDPSILGLGELVLIDRERRQEKAGRLDLLLADIDGNRRFEVEVMLGATDESHIVRTIEYWDIERRRYPAYEHCAVLVAEDITSRFLNVLGLFAGTIPLVVLQLSALKVEDAIVLDFTKVIDRTLLRTDDESEARLQAADRNYWCDRATKATVDLVDTVLDMVNASTDQSYGLTYNKPYIGLADGPRSTTFVLCRPRKKLLKLEVRITTREQWATKLEEAGLSAEAKGDRVELNLDPKDLTKHRELLAELLGEAVREHEA